LLAGCAQLPPAEVPDAPESGARAAVFDVDGTLTPSVLAVFETRPAAAEAVTAYSNKGYKIIYLSTRIPGFQTDLPAWLQRNGFPEGTIHFAQTDDERDHPADYKSGILASYVKKGWQLAYAYGDSSTDFRAYANAGIPREHVFALKRRGQETCMEGVYHQCPDGWEQNLQFVEQQVPVVQ
jgi:phosphatidate phosphatase PAH1